jgi:hypothetical protein
VNLIENISMNREALDPAVQTVSAIYKEAMDPLQRYGTYAFFPYLPTTASPSDHPPIKVNHASTWTYCGPLLKPVDLPPSLHSWSKATVSSSSALLQRLVPLLAFLHSFLEKAGVQHYWLTLRATTPTRGYDTPRWHVDDDFFSPLTSIPPPHDVRGGSKRQKRAKGRAEKDRKEASWKLCTTLLGPSTLFLHHSCNASALQSLHSTKQREGAKREHVCSSIRCAGCFDTGDAVRQSLVTALREEKVVQAEYGKIAFFRTGEEGAVHSEPPCGVDRIFVNVVPGTEEELRELMKRFGMEFPRAWSLGLPGGSATPDELAVGIKGEHIGKLP